MTQADGRGPRAPFSVARDVTFVPLTERHALLGSPPRALCPACGRAMREVAGFDDYCAPCRLLDELRIETRLQRARSRLMEAAYAHSE